MSHIQTDVWIDVKKFLLFQIQLFCPQLIWEEKTKFHNHCVEQIERNSIKTNMNLVKQWSHLKRFRAKQIWTSDVNHQKNFIWIRAYRCKLKTYFISLHSTTEMRCWKCSFLSQWAIYSRMRMSSKTLISLSKKSTTVSLHIRANCKKFKIWLILDLIEYETLKRHWL